MLFRLLIGGAFFAAVILLLSLLSPPKSEKRFWRAVETVRNAFDRASYAFICAMGLLSAALAVWAVLFR
ncbi:MAG: hypothetical protein E7423_10500 [Ruminococcaceae bacterium]|jgi:hypothetical protein|nr:hypothetical protein [Oscillospiraceae bacterium]